VAFSADGSRIVSGSLDKTVLVWDVHPLQEGEEQRERCAWLTRSDPQWHVQQCQAFLKEKNNYAAALHHCWEWHAHGVLAFERGELGQALVHLVAAAALKPKPPPNRQPGP
jgi:hypothetical protein